MVDNYVIINLVDQFSKVNFGIWHAAIATAPYLQSAWGIKTILAAPRTREPFDSKKYPCVKFVSIEDTSLAGADAFLSQWTPETTIIASHGTWQFPTRWGAAAKKLGFTWLYTPHGMLEPWSMKQKWMKKRLYYYLVERPMARKATFIRAVGSPEQTNLQKQLARKVVLIPNGVYESDFEVLARQPVPVTFLFLARLHHKKGVLLLAEGWKASALAQNTNYQLIIAGTDDGEKAKLEDFLQQNPGLNIHFVGARFGEAKKTLLQNSHYYILPSQSEGFPTSVVEAMAAGLVPVISEGCNFPEALQGGYALKIFPEVEAIAQLLNTILDISEENRLEMAERGQAFVKGNYSWSRLALLQHQLFTNQHH